MHLLDSNIIIDFMNGSPDARNLIQELANRNEQIKVSYIVLCELFEGIYRSKNPSKIREELQVFIENTNGIVEWNIRICDFYGRLCAHRYKEGKPLAKLDMMIAATAMMNDAILITNDKAFRQIEGLRVVSY
ncbi:MAG: type II toxin-antitoxin system VapC family toxin [Candidatus Woesearchaeota archaeon]